MTDSKQDKEEQEEGYSYVIQPPEKVGLAGHNWQFTGGPLIVCTSCPYEHSQFIPPQLIFKGLDDKGLPILEPVKK